MSGNKTTVSERDIKDAVRFAKKYPLIAAIIALFVIGLFIWQGIENKNNAVNEPLDGLYAHFIDIGQGDAELVSCGGEYMLIDGGEVDKGDELVRYLVDAGVKKLEYIVCTHGHSDHCGGLDDVLDSFEVGEIFTSPYPGDKKAYEIFVDAAEDAGVAVTVPELSESYKLGDAEFEFIGPVEEYDDINANSLVLRLVYGNTSFLYTGDMTAKAEKDIIADGMNVRCDVLKVGHHGSSGSSCYQFLYEAQPRLAVISCETGNSYGHPHEETLSRLRDADVEVFRTDLEGSIVLYSDGMEVTRPAA